MYSNIGMPLIGSKFYQFVVLDSGKSRHKLCSKLVATANLSYQVVHSLARTCVPGPRYLERNAVLVDATCTQQDNSYDCGAFVMLNAQHAAAAAATGAPLGTNCVPRHQAAEIRTTLADLVEQLRKQGRP